MHGFSAGDKVSGFTVRSVSSLPDYKAEGILLEHDRTGFPVYFVSSPDKELFFSYTAYTPPENSKGISHIIEHTVLSGSRKYPVKDPFMLMVRNSCNTFLNALTGVDRTYYPAASTVRKDFDNLFSIYTDAVFHPLLREETFMQEGIRISSEGGKHFEGVVFSEMLGEMAEHEFVLASASTKPLFGASAYQYESGGDAREICKLTYDEYIAAYKRFYSPANLSLFLYGDMDITPLLELLDREYLKDAEKGERIERASLTERWDKPRRYETTSEAEDGTEDSSVMVSWLLGDNAKAGESTLLSLIVDILLGSPGCPLYKAIAESDLGKDLSTESGMCSSYRELVFSAGFSGASADDAEKIEEFILSSLRDIAEKGLDQRAVEAAIRRMEFSLKEIPGGIPQGMRLFFQAEKAITFSSDPAAFLSPSLLIGEIRRKWEENPRFFDDWLISNLVDNPHRLLTVVRKDSMEGGRIEESIQRTLEERLPEYSEEKERSFIRFQRSADTEEAIRTIPRLHRTDLPRSFDRIKHTVDNHVISSPMMTGGVIYFDLVFDISDFSYSEMDRANVLSRVLSMCALPDMDYSRTATELRFLSGGYAFYVESGSDSDGNEKVFFVARLKALPEYLDDAVSLFTRLLNEGIVDDPERVKAALVDIDTDFSSSVVSNGQTYASALASSSLTPSLYIGERLSGVTCWEIISELLNHGDMNVLGGEMSAIRKKAFTMERLLVHITSLKEDESGSLKIAGKALAVFPSGGEIGSTKHTVPIEKKDRARTISSSVSFIAVSGPGPGIMDASSSSERIFLSILSNTVLWSRIREKGGAYGTGAYSDYIERIFTFYTYRDPRLRQSIEDFLSSPDALAVTEENLEDAVITLLARDLRPVSPAIRSLVDIRRIIYGIKDDDRERKQNEALSLTSEDVITAAKRFKSRLDNREYSIAVIGDRKAVAASGYDFEVRSLPVK